MIDPISKPISKAALDQLTANHKNNPDLPVITNAVFISRAHFEKFVSNLPSEYDALKICFVRFPANPKDPLRILEAGNNLTQLSLILTPVKGTDKLKWSSEDVTDQNGNLITLCVCEPGVDDQNGTGLTPPKTGEEDPDPGP